MKTFQIQSRGTLPTYIKTIVEKYNNKPSTKDAINELDSDIEFCVIDLGEAHGNLNKIGKDAWLCPRNGDNSFNVSINF